MAEFLVREMRGEGGERRSRRKESFSSSAALFARGRGRVCSTGGSTCKSCGEIFFDKHFSFFSWTFASGRLGRRLPLDGKLDVIFDI